MTRGRGLSPRAGRLIHIVLMMFWAAQMAATALIMWPWTWRTYLIELSQAALLLTNLSGWSAERPSEIADQQ